MQKIALIAAMSENRVIGQENCLPWDLPDDLRNFARVTAGKAFLMGRKSFESKDALTSDYRNVVLSRKADLHLPEGAEQAKSLEEAFDLLKDELEFFILGGGRVFEQVFSKANYLYLTIVHDSFEGDAFFPPVNWDQWKLVKSHPHPQDDNHKYAFSMNEYRRK